MMKIILLEAIRSINKAYLKTNIVTKNFNNFIDNFNLLFQNINPNESEEYNKNNISKFFDETYYKGLHYINTKDKTDLVIHKENKPESPVVVMIETKKPNNHTEMIAPNSLNHKAFHELILYYLRERIINDNFHIKNLIITNSYDWYIFRAAEFEKLFYDVKDFRKNFEDWNNNIFINARTQTFYDFCEKYIRESSDEINCVHINLKKYHQQINNPKYDKSNLIVLYKIFSPEHLLNKPFSNDSNSLNIDFYNELLYILGLEEINQSGKKLIRRAAKIKYPGTIIENTIRKLESEDRLDNITNIKQYGSNREEQFFSIALELTLTWLNRILFMKLLESQLVRYNNGNKQFMFLNPEKVNQYDQLNTLFFKVLNTKEENRYEDIVKEFNYIPYLNSSLFDLSVLEKNLFSISGLEDDIKIPLYNRTVLKNKNGSRVQGDMLTQEYFLRFLDSFNFGSTSAQDIVDEDKNLINASVLGLVFEKINGYKDGSFFTPGFITMYMASQSIRKTIINKFNETYNWNLTNITELYNNIDKISLLEANQVIDSLKICDPAVGSGHFLVSVLNEIIALKSELNILIDKNGKKLRGYQISVENDELHIENEDGKLFEYSIISGDSIKGRIINEEKQRIQETLFEQKRIIIENSLFGVDINPNSVQICSLRLWIELLKSSYYTKESNFRFMETLPNIDINIKCGNSLISRFGVTDNFPKKDIPTLKEYKLVVSTYKNIKDKSKKSDVKKSLMKIKDKFQGLLQKKDNEAMKLATQLDNLNNETDLFASQKVKERNDKKKKKLAKQIDKLRKENSERNKARLELLNNALEWRFEFPEVLNNKGDFTGFDIIIGNPPYVQLQKAFNDNLKFADLYKNENYLTFERTGDIYALFYEKGLKILKQNGLLCFITSNKWMRAAYGESLRAFLAMNNPLQLIDLGPNIFTQATVDTNILTVKNNKTKSVELKAITLNENNNINQLCDNDFFKLRNLNKDSWIILSPKEQAIKEKIEAIGTPLKDWDVNIYRGVLTGYNDAFIIDGQTKDELIAQDPKSAEIIKPILRGRDIKRYKAEFADLWIIMIPKGFTIKTILNQNQKKRTNIVSEPIPHYGYIPYKRAWKFIKENYPAIAGHLIKFKSKAEKRQDQGDYWWELRACAYLDEFEKEKIVYQEIVRNSEFYYDTLNYFPEATTFIMTGSNLKYLISLLNSKSVTYFFKIFYAGGGLGEQGFRYKKAFLIKLPIPQIPEEEQQSFEDLVEKIISKKESGVDTQAEEDKIDLMVYELYDLTYEEIKVVDPEFDKVISRYGLNQSEYENMSLEELAEL